MSIEASDLGVTIAGRRILDGVTLTCRPGQVIALVGPSGCGKTTLLNCLGLLQRPSAGAVSVNGHDTASDRARRRFWRREAAFVYQDYGLIEEETLAYNVTLRAPGFLRCRPRPDARLDGILETVGLAGRQAETASVLSGGEKQRAGVARALYKEASYVFADEPTASLDPDNRRWNARRKPVRASSSPRTTTPSPPAQTSSTPWRPRGRERPDRRRTPPAVRRVRLQAVSSRAGKRATARSSACRRVTPRMGEPTRATAP